MKYGMKVIKNIENDEYVYKIGIEYLNVHGRLIKNDSDEITDANDLKLLPTSNGLIGNFNKQLRKMIREGTIRYNSLNWVDHLNEYTKNHNNHKNTTTKYPPNEIWNEGNKKH